MWKYLLFCFAMLGWAFFELSGGQDFEPELAMSVSEVVTPTDDVDPIDRSFDREEVARAATNALRSIEFDDHAEAAVPVNVVTDVALWKVSADTETSAIIENILDDVVPVVAAAVPSDENLYAVSVNRANMRNGPSTRNGVIAKLERGTAVQLLPSSSGSWVKLRVVETNRVGWISKKLLKKLTSQTIKNPPC